jgi:hypothetical protein
MRWYKLVKLRHQESLQKQQGRFPLEKAEFDLKRTTVYCVLLLFAVETFVALFIANRLASGDLSVSTFVIGALLTLTVGRTGSLLNVIVKSVFR